MYTPILFLAINWSMYRTVSITIIVVMAAGIFLWRQMLIMLEKWGAKKKEHDAFIKSRERPVDFPEPLFIKVSHSASNHMSWKLPPQYVGEDLVTRLQKLLDKEINKHGRLSIKVESEPDGIRVNLRKDHFMELWDDTIIEAEKFFKDLFGRSMEFISARVKQVAPSG